MKSATSKHQNCIGEVCTYDIFKKVNVELYSIETIFLHSNDERKREVSIRDKSRLRNLRCAYI